METTYVEISTIVFDEEIGLNAIWHFDGGSVKEMSLIYLK